MWLNLSGNYQSIKILNVNKNTIVICADTTRFVGWYYPFLSDTCTYLDLCGVSETALVFEHRKRNLQLIILLNSKNKVLAVFVTDEVSGKQVDAAFGLAIPI